MKLTFTFSDSPEEVATRNISSYFELPDSALQLPDCKERVLKIATLVGQITQVVLHITCKELSLKHHPVKLERNQEQVSVNHGFRDTLLHFERLVRLRPKGQSLKILAPIPCPVFYRTPKSREKGSKSLDRFLVPPEYKGAGTPEQISYLETFHLLADECLTLLKTEPPHETVREWHYMGFHPAWLDKRAVTNANKAITKQIRVEKAAERRRAKQAEKPVPILTSTEIPTTGAGRRPGAIPGIFKGIQFRSQLEIRFAAQLEERGIRWAYESERLGEGQYLVDFYLPDFKCWVEVKGQFEARDNFLLKEVADYLKRERGEKLFVFTQSKGFTVSAQSFKSMPHKEFWSKLLTPR